MYCFLFDFDCEGIKMGKCVLLLVFKNWASNWWLISPYLKKFWRVEKDWKQNYNCQICPELSSAEPVAVDGVGRQADSFVPEKCISNLELFLWLIFPKHLTMTLEGTHVTTKIPIVGPTRPVASIFKLKSFNGVALKTRKVFWGCRNGNWAADLEFSKSFFFMIFVF